MNNILNNIYLLNNINSMNITYFFVGFLFGSLLILLISLIIHKNFSKSTKKALDQMEIYYENIANKLFEENSQKMTNTNKEKLEDFFSKFKEKIEDFEKQTDEKIRTSNENSQKLSDTNKERMEEFYSKFKSKIEDFEKQTNEKFQSENENFLKFDENIKQFIEAGNKISQDTNTLKKVMKSDNRKQGQWGEIVLAKVLEASGLRLDEEYFLQDTKTSNEGRPDAVIKLPENRSVIIDAKTSLASFSAYVESENEEEKENYLKEFKNSVKTHITGLASKDYSSEITTTPEYVLMFIPIESCYSLIFCDDSQLWDYAWKNGIMPVSPSTLLASLKIINSFLTVNKQNNNAKEISRLATKMLDKFADMVKNIRAAREKIDNGLRQLYGKDSIIVNAQKMTDLGVIMNKAMPEDESIEMNSSTNL